jgi:hypothetical protein
MFYSIPIRAASKSEGKSVALIAIAAHWGCALRSNTLTAIAEDGAQASSAT